MRWKRLLCTALLSIVFMALAHALAEMGSDGDIFVMPASLRSIGDSAFEDTMPNAVYLSESVQDIGPRAFAGRARLSVVCIPAGVTYIGEDAFAGRGQVLIVGLPRSYAEEWARKHGYRFIYMDVWIAMGGAPGQFINKIQTVIRGQTTDASEDYRLICRALDVPLIQNPKERPELYPIDYDFP